MIRWIGSSVESVQVVSREIAERLRDVGRRVDFVDHDFHGARDLRVRRWGILRYALDTLNPAS